MTHAHEVSDGMRIAVLVPCYNETLTIGKVVRDFKVALPYADVHVYDNNSSDDSVAIARSAGAFVRAVAQQGKGNVVRRLFADVEADVYVLVDGDDTYHAAERPLMIARLREWRRYGSRRTTTDRCEAAYRPDCVRQPRVERFLGVLVGRPCRDILSGYRVHAPSS